MKRSALLFLAAMAMSVPAFAQVDLGGNWLARQHEDWQDRSPGPDSVDYTGLPINEDARARALRYSTSALSLPERQCIYYPPYYVVFGPQHIRLWSDIDPVSGQIVAWNISAAIDRSIVTIWMDGRPHPPADALHPFAGFTTGAWDGNTLTARTTHFKEGYLRRNGVPTSDRATFTMHITRHDDMLTITNVIEDPVYLTRSDIVSRTWVLDPNTTVYSIANPCVPEAELPRLKGEGEVPSYLPGENPYINEMTERYHIPLEAVLGGEETMYPEYRKRLKDAYVAPARCLRYCCGWNAGSAVVAPNLRCNTSGTGQMSHGDTPGEGR